MQKILSSIFLITLLSLTSCGAGDLNKNISESISGLFTEATYDAHGTYAMASSSLTDISLQIVNEGGYVIRNKERERDYTRVFAIIERNDFSTEELTLFSAHNISLNDVVKLKTRLLIGSGNTESEVSHYGQLEKESKITLRSTATEFLKIGNTQIEYIIRGVLNRDSFIFKGTIEIVIKTYDQVNGSAIVKTDSKIITF